MIVDWFNGDITLNVMNLQHLKEKIIDLLGLSSSLGVLHVQEYIDEDSHFFESRYSFFIL